MPARCRRVSSSVLWVPKTWVRLRDLPILVDQPAENFMSVNGACGGRHGGKPRGWLLVQGPVRPMPVVMIYVLVQDVAQVPFVDDQQPIQALPPGRAHPPFRERVGSRSQLHRMRTIGTDVSG